MRLALQTRVIVVAAARRTRLSLRFPRWFQWYSIASGLVALVALVLFLSHQRFFLELGGMERVVAYPLIVWLTVTGMYTAVKRDVT